MKPAVFRYPENIEAFATFITPNQLIRKMKMAYPSLQNPYYITHRNGGRKISFKCARKCNAYIQYEQNEEKLYVFTEGEVEHSHPISSNIATRSELTKLKKEPISRESYQMNNLYVTAQMTNHYRRHFRCTYVSLLKMKTFYILVLSSSTPDLQIVLFALALLKQPLKNTVRALIEQFFKGVGEQYFPQTFIFNNRALLGIGQQIFKDKKTSFIHCEHETIASFKVRFGVARLVQSVTVIEDWEKEARRFATYIKENIPSVQARQIMEMRKSVCLPFLPDTFVGLGVHLFHSLVMEQTGEQNSYFTEDPATFLKNFPIKIKTTFQDFPHMEYMSAMLESQFNLLEPLRDLVEPSILRFLVRQFNKTLHCDLQPQPDGSVVISNNNYQTRCSLAKGRWECQCRFSAKTGLPCCHLMKMMMMLEIQVLEYVDGWWLGKVSDTTPTQNFMEIAVN